MVHYAVHIAARVRCEKKKPPCPKLIQAMRLVLFAKLTCILNESASHFLIGFACRSDARFRLKFLHESHSSHFDKFNHVKYTKTLLVRNPRTVFFMPFHEG